MALPRELIACIDCALLTFGGHATCLDVDVVSDDLAVALARVGGPEEADPFLWVTVLERYSNGWFETFSSAADGFVSTRPDTGTIAIASGPAPSGSQTCRATVSGVSRTRPIKSGCYLVAFAFLDRDPPRGTTVTFA